MDFGKAARRVSLYTIYGFHRLTGTGGFGRNRGVVVRGAVRTEGNPLKAALIKHHVKQFHGASCSVASVVSVVNALKELQGDGSAPITQMEILEHVKSANWKERMIDKNYKGRRGLPLAVLGEVVKSSLDTYGIAYAALETVPAPGRSEQPERFREILWKRLHDFDRRGTCLIISHFDQGAYVPTLNIPHISPVGGFDAETGQVVILDVDPEQEKFYQIPFDTFCNGLSSTCHRVFRSSGFGSGGYVFVKPH